MSKMRCPWVPVGNLLYEKYHDEEWGNPVHDDQTLFEFLILEGAQAGLSWETILIRRETYRKAFSQFNPAKVAKYDETEVARLLGDSGVIRNKLKIRSAITNAKSFLKVQKEYGSFDTYIWSFVNGQPIVHTPNKISDYPKTLDQAEKLSKDLKKRGFTFVGPTIIYAYMQACGLVNDHSISCFKKEKKYAAR